MRKKGFLFCFFSFIYITSWSQRELDVPIYVECKSCKVISLLESIENKSPYRFFYQDEWFSKLRIDFGEEPSTILSLLSKLRSEYGIEFIFRQPNNVIFIRPESDLSPPRVISEVVIGDETSNINEQVELKGIISQYETKQAIAGAAVFVKDLNKEVTTDRHGNYTLKLFPGTYRIGFSAPQLVKMEFDFIIRNHGEFNIDLFEDVTLLREVTVEDKGERDVINTTQMGVSTIDATELAKIPAYMGEVDVMRAVLSLPGVVSVGEGSAGFNIRGGLAGQNLIMMDGMPLYNPAHLAGFFSTFNPDIVKKITLYRGGVPANFGGRSSAFLDVQLHDGSMEKIHGQGGAGILTSRFSIEGPVVRNKSSFLVGIRAAYPNYIIRNLHDPQVSQSRAFFYDLNAKYNQVFKDGSTFSLSAYSSYDDINFAQETIYEFGNNAVNAEWQKNFGEKFMLSVSLINSHYGYNVEGGELDRTYRLDSYVNDARLNTEVTYFDINDHVISGGWQNVMYTISPGKYTPVDNAPLESLVLQKEYGVESAFYLQDQYTISSKLTLDVGLRYSMFFRLGPGTQTIYQEGVPRSESAVVDTEVYEKGEVMQMYGGFEPRLSLLYKVSNDASLKGGFHRIYQYIHLISNTTAVTPVDLWKLSNRYIKPNIGDQFSIGYFRTLQDNKFEASFEVYYKISQNSIDYRDGASLYLNDQIEADLLQGKGRAYGGEFLFRKNQGKLKGWLAYAYSRSLLSFNSSFSADRINNGELYPTNFDRPHDFKIFADWKLSNRFVVNGNFVYSTGRPITYPESTYEMGGVTVANYSLRNQYRIPDTHRLDISLTMSTSMKKKKALSASWTLSVYNVYGRKNPYSIFFRNDGTGIQAYRLSVFGAPFFSITYNFKF